MNILLVSGKIRFANLGVMYISSILKENRHFPIASDASYAEIKQKIDKYKVRVVGFSCLTVSYIQILWLSRKIKQEFPHILILFGGAHPTAVPEIIEEDSIDGVCIGEGEFAFLELIDKLQTGGPINQIKNWWIKQNGRIYKNPIRDLIHDLDKLPFPDRKLYYRKPACQSIIIGRGCLYSCSYCVQSFYNKLYRNKGKIYRRRSLENVMRELEQIKLEIDTEIIIFEDDIFPLQDIQWLEKFTSAYKKKIDIPFFIKTRANEVNRENIKLLKQAGCYIISMGIESGDEYVRNTLMRRNMSNRCILNAAEIINNNRIKWFSYNIIGLPGVDIEKDIETLKFNKKCRPTHASVFFFHPHPGTLLTERAKDYNLFKDYTEDWGYTDGDPHNYIVLKYPDNQKRLLQNLHHLFLFSVQFKIPIRLIQLLIRLPLGHFYNSLRRITHLALLVKFMWIMKLKKYLKDLIGLSKRIYGMKNSI